jgi:enoyl-CoA hydratase/carnithine racemase
VNQLVDEGEALGAAVALAERLAAGPRASIAAAKRLIDDGLDVPLPQGLALEREVVGHLFSTADAREGIRAFLEKRPATFGG